MGLLDDAIREHLELKRRRGADPAEVARAEQDALGPVRRERDGADELHEEALSPALQEDVQGAPEASAAPAAPEDQTRILHPQHAADPHADRAAHDRTATDDDGSGVSARTGAHDEPAESPVADAAAYSEALGAETAAHPETSVADTAAHAETGRADAPAAPEPPARPNETVEQATTEYHLDDLHDADAAAAAAALAVPPAEPATAPRAAPPAPPAGPPARERAADSDADDDRASDASEDVLEETPDFLQETPEHDRLWFEQRAPRDFDFDG